MTVPSRTVLLGPPGAGKGTQGKALARALGATWISTGETLRIASTLDTNDGRRIRELVHRGELVPDELVTEIVRDGVSQTLAAGEGFILEGYPRTAAQAAQLDEILLEQGAPLQKAVLLEAAPELLITRLLQRATIEGRADDAREVIVRRLAIHETEIEKLTAYYDQTGKLVRVDGSADAETVTTTITAHLTSAQSSAPSRQRGTPSGPQR
jgi:adenylate kinase